MKLTPDARAALDHAGLSRRAFIKGSGALVVGFSVARLTGGLGTAPGSALAQRLDGAGSNQLDSWIAIAADGNVTAYTGKCELGHGLYTAQMQLIAEELAVPFNRVKLIQCDTALTPDQGTTSGAQSHPTNFNQGNLALAGATAREALLQRAATRLGVPIDQLVVSDGDGLGQDGCVEKGRLRRAGRRPALRPAAQPGGETKTSERVDRSRNGGAARRVPGDGDRPVRVRPQRARPRHVARARRPAAGGRRHAGRASTRARSPGCPAW